jgi:hypothetical protein
MLQLVTRILVVVAVTLVSAPRRYAQLVPVGSRRLLASGLEVENPMELRARKS